LRLAQPTANRKVSIGVACGCGNDGDWEARRATNLAVSCSGRKGISPEGMSPDRYFGIGRDVGRRAKNLVVDRDSRWTTSAGRTHTL
jgi:hypothetical protein